MPGRQMTFMIGVLILCAGLAGLAWPAAALPAGDDLQREIRRHVEENSLYPVDHLRVEVLSSPPAPDRVKGKVSYSIDSRSGEALLGETTLQVRLYEAGRFAGEKSIRVRIEVLQDFVFSLGPVARNTVLSDQDVTVQKRWVRRIAQNAVSSLDEVLGKRLTVSVRPQTQITRNMLREDTPVKKGKMVQVILHNGALSLMTNAVAEEDGAEDALVRVRNWTSNKVISARVIGPSKVQVDFF
jgi:flagella basal body P-ring formation protein FlgA